LFDNKLGNPKTYTKMPNDILQWIYFHSKSAVEVRIVALIVRLSSGFHKSKTIKRFSMTNFAEHLGCSVSSVSRVVNRLVREKRIFQTGQQGNHFYYSLYPVAERDPDAKQFPPNENKFAPFARGARAGFAPKQNMRGGVEHISSVIKEIQGDGN